jgi:DNA-binding transcriptional regulator YiaG
MPNFAAALKAEIQRLARKEVKSQVSPTRQIVARYRREIAALKRQLAEQQKGMKRLLAQKSDLPTVAAGTNGHAEDVRFSAKSVRSQRSRLGLSAKDYGRLVGVSLLTIYNWEQGKSRPRKAQMDALVAVRGIGKREALARLAQLNGKRK